MKILRESANNKYACPLLLLLTIFSSSLFAASHSIDRSKDYYSGGWVWENNQKFLELAVWKVSSYVWYGVLFDKSTHCTYLFRGDEGFSATNGGKLSATYNFFHLGKLTSNDCAPIETRYLYVYALDVGTMAIDLREKSKDRGVFGSQTSNISEQIKFERAKISSDLQRIISALPDLKNKNIFPITLPQAKHLDEFKRTPDLESQDLIEIARRKTQEREAYDNAKDAILVSTLTSKELISNQYQCKPYTSEVVYDIGPNIKKVPGVKHYYSFDDNFSIRMHYFSNGWWKNTEREFYPDPNQPENYLFLCNNVKAAAVQNQEPPCIFCKYRSGLYLNSIYRKIYHKNLSVGMTYLQPFEEAAKSKGIAQQLYALTGLSLDMKRLSMEEEVLAYYLKWYSKNEPSHCFSPGAITRTFTYDHGDWVELDEFGVEVERIDRGTTVIKMKVNPEFIDACGDLCESTSVPLMIARSSSAFTKDIISSTERNRIIDLFDDLKSFLIEYPCDSPVRKKFEDGLLTFYERYR